MKTRLGCVEWVKNIERIITDESSNNQEEEASDEDSW